MQLSGHHAKENARLKTENGKKKKRLTVVKFSFMEHWIDLLCCPKV